MLLEETSHPGEDFHVRIVIPTEIQISFDLVLRQSITSKGKQLIIQLIKLYSCSQKTLQELKLQPSHKS